MMDGMTDGLTMPADPYVSVPVDFQYLEWHGWEAFRILDAGIRRGVVYAHRGNLRGDYQSAELVRIVDHYTSPTGRLVFRVEA